MLRRFIKKKVQANEAEGESSLLETGALGNFVESSMGPTQKEGGKNKIEANAFQIECENEVQWKKLLRREGLIVIDVYASWAGPCTSMVAILKKLKVEINDERLWYGLAQSDDISELHMFQDQSEPTWLFVGGGKPVKVMRGSDVPKLTALIKSEFEHELACMSGKAKRNLISIDDEVSRRRKAESEAEKLMKFMKDEDMAANDLNVVRRESSIRLMNMAESYSILIVQNYLLETGALTEIRDELFGDFRIEEERSIELDEIGARALFRIPTQVPDYENPIEIPVEVEEIPLGVEESVLDMSGGEEKKRVQATEKRYNMIQIPLPPGLTGTTHLILLESMDLKRQIEEGRKPSSTSPLQTGDDYLQLKVGPLSYKDALEHAPNSFHAMYGKGEYCSGVWCPRRYDDKRYVLINFFPRFVTELLTPGPVGEPKYALALFPITKQAEVNESIAMHVHDVLATAGLKLSPELLDEILSTVGPKESDHYKELEAKLKEDLFAVSLNRKNSGLCLGINSLAPLHLSPDLMSGKYESGKLFPQLGIELDKIPNPDAFITKFMARSKKRPDSFTSLALPASYAPPPSMGSESNLDTGDDDEVVEEKAGGEEEEKKKSESETVGESMGEDGRAHKSTTESIPNEEGHEGEEEEEMEIEAETEE